MDLEKLKRSVQKDISDQEVAEKRKLRRQILSSMITMHHLMDSFYMGWKQKMTETVNEFLAQLLVLLEKNEFTVIREDSSEDVAEGTTLTATYETVTIQVKNINYDGDTMEVTSSAEHNAQFFFGTPKEVPNYYLWRNHVDICGTKLCTLPDDLKQIYRHFIKKDTCLDELYIIQDEIEGNINHYKRGILDLDFVQLCIYNKCNKYVYRNFQEFWDDL